MNFNFYLQQGINHILDLNGYDHLLFVVALCAIYQIKNLKSVLIVLTAFTVGHSITLILAGLEILKLPQDLIETLIPITIMLTALSNIVFYKRLKQRNVNWNYFIAVVFGLIHGAGFSNFFRAMFTEINSDLILPLLAFNLGIEVGQIIIAIVYFIVLFLLQLALKFNHQRWSNLISGLCFVISTLMLFGVL
ncbi:HupE/UreJ family protein [Luteibaculum oceani]|uniref:HupE/UreJ family protein n=1 Tax=Luteibaculum oceani TaxID=1294296 RepID=A0A5C6UZG9_9FLAO|nr:HupE/UreJ family protein [Luteibaculum oceani]TXC78667.1 HupE/UreJ family protein [Luteibaculum oceani]